MNILITGGAGFIGAHIVRNLVEDHSITVVDCNDISNSCLESIGIKSHTNLRYYKTDIAQNNFVSDLSDDYNYIIHAAGVLGIDYVNQFPLETMQVNGIGTFNILQLVKRQKDLQKLLYFSTSEIYGPNSSDVNEDQDAIIPTVGMRWNYAASKLYGEYLIKAASHELKISSIIVRPFNVYGPHRKGKNAMTQLIKLALSDEPLVLTGTGQQLRSWCYITDFVEGILKCLKTDNSSWESYNIGDDRNYLSIEDLAKKIIMLSKSKSEIIVTNQKMDDIVDRKPDLYKIKNQLGYNPQISLDEGIKNVIGWLKVNK